MTVEHERTLDLTISVDLPVHCGQSLSGPAKL